MSDMEATDTLRVFTVAQVAERLGVSESHVRTLMSDGRLRSTALGERRVGVSAAALAEFIETNTGVEG
jgi:excisionase family DNA binding protein